MIIRQMTAALAASLALTTLAPMAAAQSPADLVKRAASSPGQTVDHSAWSALLNAHVRTSPDGLNRVDYSGFKRSGHGALKAYVERLQRVDPAKLDRREQFAFFANLYNAKTIDIVLDEYPVKSIKDISLGGGLFAAFTGGPWKAKVLRVGGMDLSLDDIEHEILRPVFKDPRVHYAVNCASVGCPNLATEALTGANLDTLLEAGARAYVNNPRGVKVSGGKVVVSSIYSWFKADFGGSDTCVLEHLRKYAAPDLVKALQSAGSLSGHDYDWRLNDTRAGQS